MPSLSKNEGRQLEAGVRTISTSNAYGQPLLQGSGNGSLPLAEDSRVPSSSENTQSLENGGDAGGDVSEGATENEVSQSGLDSSNNQDEQHQKDAAPSSAAMTEHLQTNPPMELAGHSFMLPSYPFLDPQYAGIHPYAAQVLPNFYGIQQGRMPLPLPMEEAPVYVNAKQYHGILRRRERRAKAELEKKVIKVRKPYLHESRHQHAIKRVRGTGGRFLNTKKSEGKTADSLDGHPGATNPNQSGNSSGSQQLTTSCNDIHEQTSRNSAARQMPEIRASSKENTNGHRVPSQYYMQPTGSEGSGNWRMMAGQAPPGVSLSNK